MQRVKDFTIQGLHGKPIVVDLRFIADGKPKPIIIFSHGFKGFKDWGHFNLIADAFAQAGFFMVKYNFAFNGTTLEKPTEFADLDAFGNNNLSKELDDLHCMIDFADKADEYSSEKDPGNIYLLGHSRGGGISILKTATEPRVKRLVTLASVGQFGWFWTEDMLRDWKQTGFLNVENSRTAQSMPMFYQYYEDYIGNLEKFDLEKAVKSIHIPFMAIHGTKDGVIPYTLAQRFHTWNENVEVATIEGGDHTLGGRHPYLVEKLPVAAQEAVDLAIAFFRR